MDSFIRTPLPYKAIFETITNKEMTSAKEQNPLSDLDKDLLQGRFDVTRAAFVEREDDKIPFMGRPLIGFLTQQYTICLKRLSGG